VQTGSFVSSRVVTSSVHSPVLEALSVALIRNLTVSSPVWNSYSAESAVVKVFHSDHVEIRCCH